jgi:predicted transposase YbfD/YdcC
MATTPRPLAEYFAELRDPRVQLKCVHNFMDIILIVVCATIGGADDFVSVAQFAQAKEEWFRDRLGLQLDNGIPSHDTLNRVFAIIHPAQFQKCFLGWVESMSDRLKLKQIPIDGKAMRGSGRKTSAGARTVQVVSAWSSENGVTLAQVRTDEKSNEITAIPELLRLVDITGAIITIDALGTQKAIAEQIIDSGADYVLALKGNQETLHQAVLDYVDQHLDSDFAGTQARRYRTSETGHGREEVRTYLQMPVPQALRGQEEWKGLRTIGLATLVCRRDGQETGETRYFISSLPLGVQRFARAVRSHWSVENSCHWSLDMTFREDESRIREPQVRSNFAWLNRFTLSLLKQHPGKESVAMKRRACGWSDDYLLQVLTGTTT